jgi:CRP/FNR family transcriptional regulator, nitrogen oxide reductase regulator
MTTGSPLASRALASLELFRGLSPAALDDVLAAARVHHLAKEARVFNQGDPGVRAHGLISGGVRISQSGSDGTQIVIRFIGPGEMFGTVALFTDGRYPADAVTLVDSVEASWSEAELFELMGRHPEIAINVIRVIGKRLQEAQERLREVSTQRVEQRVARAVLRLAHQAGHSTIDGTAIEFRLRRKDVADIAGTTLHTASRILTAWEKAGLLITHNQRLTLRRPSEILRIAEDSPD